MATSQAATPGPTSAPSSSAASGEHTSKTATTSTAAAGASGASSTSKDVASASSRSSTPAATALPVRDKEALNRVLIDRSITRDWIHMAALRDAQHKDQKDYADRLQKSREYRSLRHENRHFFPPSVLYGEGYRGYGNGRTETGGPSRILYPQHKPRPGKRQTPVVKQSKKDMAQQADQHEELVPVRLDVDWDKVKLRDTFTWNLHERLIPVKIFAAQLIEDMGLKPPLSQPVFEQVQHQILEQLHDFYPPVFSEEDALDPELPYSAYKNDEMRILVKLNITIGPHTLVDQFEWEMNNPMNSPEEFAALMSKDLSLSGEFTTAIAHCIREQTQLFTKSLYSIGHSFDGRPIEDADLVNAFLPSPLPTVFRPQQQAKEYAPYLYELSDADLERNEVIFSREQRRQKRSVNRRGGPQLPDLKERQRTIRTLIVSSVLPGAVLDEEDSKLYKRPAGAGTTTRKRGAVRDGDISDSESSDDSAPDSPAMSQLAGTARTRGMRGAATAAQQRMANLGRSETPEAATIHHHETRISKRFNQREARESTEEPTHLLVTLRVSKEKLKKFFRDAKLKQATPSGSQTPVPQPQRAASASASGAMGPPLTPSSVNQSLPPKPSTPSVPHGQIGRVLAPPPPPPGQQAPTPPPPPQWLTESLHGLLKQYPNDQFEGVMRYCALNKDTDQVVPAPPTGQPVPENIKFWYLPRIRCLDCPGKLYTPGPEMTVQNFEVHLKNRQHREKVDQRVGRATSAPRSTPTSTPQPGGPSSQP